MRLLSLIGLHLGLLKLGVLRRLLAVDLEPLAVDLHPLLRGLRGDLRRVHRGRRGELLHDLLGLLDHRRHRGEDLIAILDSHGAGLGQHPIHRLAALNVLAQALHVLADVATSRLVADVEHAGCVPQGDVLLEVVQHHRDVGRSDQRVHAERRVLQVREVRLQVGDVVLLGERQHRAAKAGGDVLVHRVLFLRLNGRGQQFLGVRDFQRVEDALLNLTQVVELRHGLSALLNRLHLSETLGLAEDVRVADRHHVERAVEVRAGRDLVADLFLLFLVVEVHAVEAVQDAQQLRHGVVQAGVDGRVDHHALLQLGQRGADRSVRVAVGHVVQRRADHALASVDEEAEHLEQHRVRRVVRQRHDQLADVVRSHAALDLHDLRRLYLQRLAATAAALQL